MKCLVSKNSAFVARGNRSPKPGNATSIRSDPVFQRFSDGAFLIPEFGPNSEDRSFWVTYRFPIMRGTFGFHPIHGEEEQQLLECELPNALALLEMFYRRAHEQITATLPPPPPFSTMDLERESE